MIPLHAKKVVDIIIEILIENPVRSIDRAEIRRRYVLQNPHQDRPVYQSRPSRRCTTSVGSRAHLYVKNALKILELEEIIQRYTDSITVLDVPALVRMRDEYNLQHSLNTS